MAVELHRCTRNLNSLPKVGTWRSNNLPRGMGIISGACTRRQLNSTGVLSLMTGDVRSAPTRTRRASMRGCLSSPSAASLWALCRWPSA